ncbi:hypothetical protein C8F01DRAFT_1307389 [Mycena amicta]|nr:hypothetical protein C8F01DRAFT_1307389 [Mycena amicta]
MHPSLALENLESLSPKHKKIAETALSGPPSAVPDFISKLVAMPNSRLPLFLPVLFALLDTVHIDLDVFESSTRPIALDDRILAVVAVVPPLVHLIDNGTVALEALDDIWPRVWAWTEFIQKFHIIFHTADDLCADFYTKFARIVASVRSTTYRHPTYERMISETPGYLTFVGSAWTRLLRAKETVPVGLMAVSLILAMEAEFSKENPKDTRDGQVQSLVTTAGGTWDAFAAVLIEHIQLAIPSPESQVDKHSLALLSGVIKLLREAVDHYPELRTCLANRGIINTIVIACRAVLERHSSIPEPLWYITQELFVLLTGHILTVRSQTRVVEALRAGLLPLIVAHGRAPPRGEGPISRSLLFILSPVLLESTVFYSVLAQLRISLEELGNIDPAVFTDGEVGKMWGYFVKLVRGRLEVVKLYEAGGLTKLRACDNLKCSAIREAGQIQRCSGCQSAYYCSQACQKTDYKSGKHREICSTLRSRRDDYCAAVGDEDRAFLRALVNYEYDKMRMELAVGLVGIMSMHPQCTPYLVFDFSHGSCSIQIQHSLDEELSKELEIDVKRREGHDGRMEMHVVGIRAGRAVETEETTRWMLMPLRSSSAELHDALRWVAQSITVNVTEADGEQEVDIAAYAGAVQQILALFPVTGTH